MAGQCSAGTRPRVFHMLGALAATPIAAASAATPPDASMAFSRGVMAGCFCTHVCECNSLTHVTQPLGLITGVNTFPERLKDAREKLGISQAELARRLGLRSTGSVGNWESGFRSVPRELVSLATELKVRPEWLRHGKGPRDLKPGEVALDVETALQFLADQMSCAQDLPVDVVKASLSLLVDGRSNADRVQKAIRLISESLGPSGDQSGKGGSSKLETQPATSHG